MTSKHTVINISNQTIEFAVPGGKHHRVPPRDEVELTDRECSCYAVRRAIQDAMLLRVDPEEKRRVQRLVKATLKAAEVINKKTANTPEARAAAKAEQQNALKNKVDAPPTGDDASAESPEQSTDSPEPGADSPKPGTNSPEDTEAIAKSEESASEREAQADSPASKSIPAARNKATAAAGRKTARKRSRARSKAIPIGSKAKSEDKE